MADNLPAARGRAGRPRSDGPLHRQPAVLVGAAAAGGFFAVAGDDPDAFVELGGDAGWGGGFEKGDAVGAAGAEDALAGFPHLGRVVVARHLQVAEREGEVARAELGKADSGGLEDFFAMR